MAVRIVCVMGAIFSWRWIWLKPGHFSRSLYFYILQRFAFCEYYQYVFVILLNIPFPGILKRGQTGLRPGNFGQFSYFYIVQALHFDVCEN